MAVLSILLTVIIVAISVLIVLIVLLQRPKQEGLGAAFGGSTLDGALGAQTTDILQKATTVFAVIFFVCSIGLAMVKTRQFKNDGSSAVLEKLEQKEPLLPNGLPEGIGAPAPLTPSDPAPVIPAEKPAPKADDAKGEAPEADAAEAPAGKTDKGAAKADAEKAPAPAAKKDAPKAEKAAEKKEAPAPAAKEETPKAEEKSAPKN